MKSTIKKLPESIISKIAAGQVVQHPASVIKELVENSLDANSTQIDIDLENAGIKRIQIADNGAGMTKNNLSRSFLPHTTSKLSQKSDLHSISTLGFRGEALSSIASVATLKISSKVHKQKFGYSYRLNKSMISDESKIGMQTGTTINVYDLFSNTPARKKHLKSSRTELTRCIDAVEQIALSNPQVGFRLTNNKKLLIEVHPESAKQRIASIIGSSLFNNMVPLSHSQNHIKITGFLGVPQVATSNKNKLYIFVNNRPVKQRDLSKTIKQSYGTLLGARMYPACVLNISLPTAMVDVNIHPQKSTVSIINNSKLLTIIDTQIRNTLDKHNLTYQATSTSLLQFNKTLSDELIGSSKPWSVNLSTNKLTAMQFDDVYILAKTETEVLLIDQHAAHEKILFNQYKNEFSKSLKRPKTIALEPSKIINLSSKDHSIIIHNIEKLKTLGFSLEDFGKHSLKIRSIPKFAKDIPLNSIIVELATKSLEDLSFQTIATVACKAAIKDGDKLTHIEIKKLIRMLFKTDDFYTCPHGRPTVIRVTRSDLDSMFKR